MAKCNRCGRHINPQRGFCTFFKCHNKLIGGATPEPHLQRARWNSDKKRCPFCLGREGRAAGKGPCFISACDRADGKPCGCHFIKSGMGTPGQEGWATLRAKHIGLEAGGGARFIA